ncbi:MAG: dephospho-CoA kinase [Gemmatimonadetes bacterium]|nr:dephospho-CoA kinase [Gemmatimonadota bacterium]
MLRVALTGNVAAGKSAVAEAWIRRGVPVVSADELARRAVEPGTRGLSEVRGAFGDGVLAADGTLNRSELRTRIFRDEAARRRLEAILHPRIQELRVEWMEAHHAQGAPLVVAEIPLLFETGLEDGFDAVVLVDAPADVRLARLVERRGLGREEALRIMEAQMDPAEKRRRADWVVDNAGTMEALDGRAVEVLGELRARAAAEADTLRMDLHLHTAGSRDCLSDPRAVLERATARGYGRIAITDHNHLGVALRMAEVFPDRIIPGEEVKTAEGIDVIGLYLSQEIPKGTPAVETVARIRAQGGIPYLPHPYAAGKGGGGRMADELAALVDVVEVFNARLHPGRLNAPAEALAARHGKLRGAGSDAHTLGELGGAFVDVPVHPNRPDALLSALPLAAVGGRTASSLVHLASTWAKVRKRLPGAPDGTMQGSGTPPMKAAP